MLCLAQDEVAADVQVHDLVPGIDRVVFGRRAPGSAGVVDEDVHMAEAFDGFIRQRADVRFLRAVGSDPVDVDAGGLEFGSRFLQVFSLARAQHDFGAGFAERLRQLQAQAA
jgi:hypothetical protein